MDRRSFLATTAALSGTALAGARAAPAAADPAAATRLGNRYRLQRALVDRRFGMFIHFNMGTFHDAEWVEPGQDPASFAPDALDCAQWAAAARSAGMTFAVLTAKHHDGFCLWPSAYSPYTVAASSYPHDVVREYMAAFRAAGVTPCLYFSIWDRTMEVAAPVSRADIDLVKHQLTELLTGYGPIPLLVFDGWAWLMGHQEVPYGEIRAHVASLQPDCLVLDLNGLTVPWESDLLFIEETKNGVFCPPDNRYAATQGQTIVPTGWFWHPATPASIPLSVESIVDDHLRVLESRWCTFILNCPPNDRGLLDAAIVDRLAQVGQRWRPDLSRPQLPPQPDVLRFPATPLAATATSGDPAPAVDGVADLGWNGQVTQTLWRAEGSAPQSVTLDLGRERAVDLLTYLPRQDTVTDWAYDYVTAGNVTAYRVTTSRDGRRFTEVARGRWAGDHGAEQARFRPVRARYVRLEALSTVAGTPPVASEVGCGLAG